MLQSLLVLKCRSSEESIGSEVQQFCSLLVLSCGSSAESIGSKV